MLVALNAVSTVSRWPERSEGDGVVATS